VWWSLLNFFFHFVIIALRLFWMNQTIHTKHYFDYIIHLKKTKIPFFILLKGDDFL
jgi:hypothetical protein